MKRLVFAVLLVGAGCAHKEDVKPNAPVASTPSNAPAHAAETAPAQPSPSSDTSASNDCSTIRVHFAFNSAELEDSERNDLERSASCLKADRALHVAVEGNADERGTEEYNLALGDHRAEHVAKYLSSLGVSKSQLKTVSYGKENPICTEHDESCWAQNRRAELKLAERDTKPKHKRRQ